MRDLDLSRVYHVGFLAADSVRPKGDYSLEGGGLSVSQHPEAWIKIAQLGGSNLYELTKADPNFYMAIESNEDKALEWCVDQGYLIPKRKFHAYHTDEEGEEYYFELESRKAAEAESEDVREADGYVFGPKGKSYWQANFKSKLNNSLARAYAVIFYAEALGYDGVWWNEALDVSQLSAPRGVIFQHKLSEWKLRELSAKSGR